MPQRCTATHIELPHVKLWCQTWGAGDPLVFVHGFPLSGEMWHATATALADAWWCLVPDLRGHGRSAASPTVTIAQFADDLAALLDAFGERRPVVLVGLSMGGIILFEFYRRHRDRVRALVLCDTRPYAETDEGRARRETIAEAALRDGSAAAAALLAGGLFAPTAPAELVDHWRAVMAATPPIGLAAAARALADRPDSVTTLPTIDCPTLLVFGEADALTPVEIGRQMQHAIAGSSLEVIPAAGHLPPVEQPAHFTRVLREFLAKP